MTEKAIDIIIAQSDKDKTLVESRPPISKLVKGIVTLANCTKNSNNINDAIKAILIALFEKAPNENILSSCDRQFITLNNWNIINTDKVIVWA